MAGFWRRVFGVPETRNIDKMAVWGSGGDISGATVDSGVTVSQSNALQLVAVWACVRVLSDAVAVLPIDAFRRTGEERELVPRQPVWMSGPNPETTWFEFSERLMSSLNLDGNAFVLITARDSTGYPSELWTLNPRDIVVRQTGGKTSFEWQGSTILSRFGPQTPGGDLLHIKAFNNGGLRGLSPIDTARQAIGLGMAEEKFSAGFYGRGQQLSGVISLPPMAANATTEAKQDIADGWKKRHAGPDKAFGTAVLTGGATWTPLAVTPEDAQFLEQRKFQVIEIARLFNVPPHMIQEVDTTTSWGTGIEQQSIGFVRFSLMPWIVRLEQGLSQLLPRGQFVKFNLKQHLRADAAAEADAFAKAVQNGWMNRAEVRRLLEMPADDSDLEKYLYPSNLKVVGEVTPPPVTVPAQSPPVDTNAQGGAA